MLRKRWAVLDRPPLRLASGPAGVCEPAQLWNGWRKGKGRENSFGKSRFDKATIAAVESDKLVPPPSSAVTLLVRNRVRGQGEVISLVQATEKRTDEPIDAYEEQTHFSDASPERIRCVRKVRKNRRPEDGNSTQRPARDANYSSRSVNGQRHTWPGRKPGSTARRAKPASCWRVPSSCEQVRTMGRILLRYARSIISR